MFAKIRINTLSMPSIKLSAARAGALICLAAAAAIAGAACGGGGELRIGLLMDRTGTLGPVTAPINDGANLAVKHINEAGGVNGQDVRIFTGDTKGDIDLALSESRRLISEENVNVIIGAAASHVSLALAEEIAAKEEILLVSPASSANALTDAEDNDFFFRTTVTNAHQGAALANTVLEEIGQEDSVGVIHINNAFGQGYSSILQENYDGNATVVSYEAGETSFASVLQQAGAGGADSLVIIGYSETSDILREAEEMGTFNNYYFVSSNRAESIAAQLDASVTEGSYGTAPGDAPGDSPNRFRDAFFQEFMRPTQGPFEAQAYDAVVAVALAAAAAGSSNSAEIRDQLRAVAGPPGTIVLATTDSLRMGLNAAADGEDVDFSGAASAIDWDASGDITGGFVQIWRFMNHIPTVFRTVEAGN